MQILQVTHWGKRIALIHATFGALHASLSLCADTKPEPAPSAFPQSLGRIAPNQYGLSANCGPDETNYFIEFQNMRLMRPGPNGLEIVLEIQPGIYGVVSPVSPSLSPR